MKVRNLKERSVRSTSCASLGRNTEGTICSFSFRIDHYSVASVQMKEMFLYSVKAGLILGGKLLFFCVCQIEDAVRVPKDS